MPSDIYYIYYPNFGLKKKIENIKNFLFMSMLIIC